MRNKEKSHNKINRLPDKAQAVSIWETFFMAIVRHPIRATALAGAKIPRVSQQSLGQGDATT